MKIHVSEGELVKKGQLLVTFDTRLSSLQKKQAQAAVDLATVQAKNLERELDRISPLLESGAISQGEFDKLKAQHDAAKAGLDQARAAEALSSYQIRVSRIKAPISGVVARKIVNEGEIVAPGAIGPYGMLTIMDLERVVVRVGVGEKDMPYVLKGMDADVTVDAYPEEVFRGAVNSISPAADPLSKTFPVEVIIPNVDMKLKAGMFARVDILIETKENVVAVPESAVLEEKNEKVLFYVDEEGRARKVSVKTGIRSGGLVEVVGGGLDPAREVIVEGNFGLRDGAAVIRTK